MSDSFGVGVVGAGAWGLSLAAATARNGHPTVVYSRRSDGKVPKGVERTSDLGRMREARLVIVTVPSHVAREVAIELGDHLDGSHLVVHGVRGLAGDELETICDVLRKETPAKRLGALGGPVLAEDLLASKPSVIVCGSAYPEVNAAVERALGNRILRVYTTHDLRGVEWASALVGCLAIGIGYAQALELGPGLSAAVITRAIGEAARIAAAAGGDERTILGLEVRLGAALAKGKPLEEAIRAAELRVEAVELIPRIVAWAERNGVRTPILAALGEAVFKRKSPTDLVELLMTRPKESLS